MSNRRFFSVAFLAVILSLAASFAGAYTTHQSKAGPLTFYFGTKDRLAQTVTLTELEKTLTLTATLENGSDKELSVKLVFRTIETFEIVGAEPMTPDELTKTVTVPVNGKKDVDIAVIAKPGTYQAHYPIDMDVEFQIDDETVRGNVVQIVEVKIPQMGTVKNPVRGQQVTNADKPENVGLFLSADEKAALFAENLKAVKSAQPGKTEDGKTFVYSLDDNVTAAITFGKNGFVDGVIGVGNSEKQVQFDGLRVWSKGQPIGSWPTTLNAGSWIEKGAKVPPKNAEEKTNDDSEQRQSDELPPKPETKASPRSLLQPKESDNTAEKKPKSDRKGTWAQEIGDVTFYFSLEQNGSAIQFSVDASEADAIDRIEFGPATETAKRVYYGHGFCIEEPEAFTAHAGGHDLSTSHVGVDFVNGVAVLQATSFPPDRFVVDPKEKRYTLSVHPATTITLLPGLTNALDCAVKYRSVCDKIPSPGFKTKAGRFVFDIWGGKYKEHTEIVKNAVQYGLTDSLFINHVWQRFGYDNVLPDIWPPDTRFGTLADMQETLELCNKNGIQYGLHDNYIDFYPDADDFNFDVTTFGASGQPVKAWNNHGIEAQSYQFRPDFVQKFLERNLNSMLPELPVSTYFVDVFTSLAPMDYYDREGNFHSRAETQAAWEQAFDTIRERLSAANKTFGSATTSSEAGMDSLIGHLDGADCQFLFLSPEPGEHRIPIKCKNWSRVPWFDIVHHTKFSLHGVGYSNRYEAQRGRLLHGIESDDYIVSEILTGHSLMVDRESAKRGAVRKYWLLQDVVKHLADKEIKHVEFVDGNIHHLKITWSGETIEIDDEVETLESVLFINTGTTDWELNADNNDYGFSHILPPYGFIVWCVTDSGFIMASLKREQDGRVIESSMNLSYEEFTTEIVKAIGDSIEAAGKDALSDMFKDHVGEMLKDDALRTILREALGDDTDATDEDVDEAIKEWEDSINDTIKKLRNEADKKKEQSEIILPFEGKAYVNARQNAVQNILPITPSVEPESFKYLGDNKFSVKFVWNAKAPAPKDLCVFVHCVEKRQNWHHKPNEAVLGGAIPTVPTSEWSGEIVTDNHNGKNEDGIPVTFIPDDLPAGRYYFVVGLYDQKGNGQRAKLAGFDTGNDRYAVGWLSVQRKNSKVSDIALEPFEWEDAKLFERYLPQKGLVEFEGICKTNGAFKIERAPDGSGKMTIITPLPDEPAFEICLNVGDKPPKSIKAIDADGKKLRDVPFEFKEGEKYPLCFETKAGEFQYVIE